VSAWTGAMLYFGYSVCRSHGDTRLPGYLMIGTSLLNIALDPLYIFVFGWGLPGAAWATITAFGIGALIIYPALLKRQWISFELRQLSLIKALKQLNGIMAPAMVSQLMPPASAMLATAMVAGFGSAAVAAWGLGTRLEFFSIVVVLALTMSLPPMIGRMLGAGDIGQDGRIMFFDPMPLGREWKRPPYVSYMPETGTLLLFPSFLTHMVAPYAGDTPRISLAFNLAVER